MEKRYIVNLTEEEREELTSIVGREKVAAHKSERARMLLLADEGWTDRDIADKLDKNVRTVERVRQRCCERGVLAALERKKQENPSRPKKLDGAAEAQLAALACSEPPDGRSRWTVTLLADKLVELGVVDSVSRTTVHRALKKNALKPWRVRRWCIPAPHSAAFVLAMEGVLDVYHRPYDASRPVVCFDETSKQLLQHVRVPIPARPGQPRRVDDEYRRCGTANIFAALEPLTGEVLIEATASRDFVHTAHFLKRLSDEVYPDAEKIILVMDNVSSHNFGCFYQAFEPEEARRLVERFEVHNTPTHGSWLNVAEILLSVMARQCLDQRIDTMEALQRAIAAWIDARGPVNVDWQFTTDDARIKLRHLYPTVL